MKKNAAENLKNSLPSFMTNLGGYIKSLLTLEDKKELIGNATGSIGFLIQLFGKPFLDGYYERLQNRKLSDFGFDTYAFSAFKQSNKSLLTLKEFLSDDIPVSEVILGLEKDFIQKIADYEKKFSIYVFQPKYHPAIQLVSKMVVEMLLSIGLDITHISMFKKDFNSNIEKTIEEVFGDSYEHHKQEIKQLLLKESETKLLIDTINNSKIGFSENEDLKYEDAFGAWMPLSSKRSFDENHSETEIVTFEKSLKRVEQLIEEYFSVDPDSHLDKALFIVADFGKGKSIFLKQYAASLAKNYLENGDGYFPIYFNLRTYANYSGDAPLGVIEDYLQTEYAIKITSDYFRVKHFVFLVDSLDESCDLSRFEIEKVLNSVKRIQNIDKATIRTNRLIITSRPFDDVLFQHISHNKPYLIKNENTSKEIAHFLSLYGFKKEQFNDWIYNTLKAFVPELEIKEASGFILEVIRVLKDGGKQDIYSILINRRVLSSGELRRPIFAYMIYQLLINNINVTQVGKIGIYLSFLNLLTKEAKYINDPNLKINLQEQFEARNVLHQIAALWLYERVKGKQGGLKKADICRIIGDFSTVENDNEVIEKYKNLGFSDIQFLSHSYFGENNNILHFQHQSFAEVLLAEYYLKVFIRCALERSISFEFVITKLKIGNPTSQCIEFFIELLYLLKDSVAPESTPQLMEKRKLLSPLLASIALHKNNKSLNSEKLFYQWYEPAGIDENTTEIPNILLEKWCIDKNVIENIISLCEEIVNSDEIFLLSKSSALTSLIKSEVSQIHNKEYEGTLFIEKYLSLIVGNTLFNEPHLYFIRKFPPFLLIKLMNNAKHEWLKRTFKGVKIEFEKSKGYLSGQIIDDLHLYNFDFTDSIITNVIFINCHIFQMNFNNAQFTNVYFMNSFLWSNNFKNVECNGIINLSSATFTNFGLLPSKIIEPPLRMAYSEHNSVFEIGGRRNVTIAFGKFYSLRAMDVFFSQIAFYLKYCIDKKFLTVDEILTAFPTRKEKYKVRIREIMTEISESGDFERLPNNGIENGGYL